MEFYLPPLTVPEGTHSEELVLRPLRASNAELDYDAVVSSRVMLRRWSGSDEWPTDDFTLAENRADLERHEREYNAREAFAYTVLNPDGTRCLGCVYFSPLWAEEAAVCPAAERAVGVGFWVRASEIEHELDRKLLALVRCWLTEEWNFDLAVFHITDKETRQAEILADAGLKQFAMARLRDGRTLLLYV